MMQKNVRHGGANGKLYRARDGKIMGVCKGVAEHFGITVTLVRLIAILGTVFTGVWPMLIGYIAAGFLLQPKPVLPVEDAFEEEFYSSYVTSRSATLARLKERFTRLERRVGRMEDTVTSRSFDWERRLGERR